MTDSDRSIQKYGTVVLIGVGAFVLGIVVAHFSSRQVLEEVRFDVDEIRSETVQNSRAKESTSNLQLIETQTQNDSYFDRRRTLHNLFVNVGIRELELYYAQSKDLVSQNFSREAQNKIVQRWSALDPSNALNLVLEDFSSERQTQLIHLVFQEWSRTDLTDAIIHAQQLDPDLVDVAADAMVTSREELTVEQRRGIARQLGREWRAIEILMQESSVPVIGSPSQEWTAFVRDNDEGLPNLDEAQLRLMGFIVLSWVKLEGSVVMAQVREELPRSVSLLNTTEFIARELMETHPDRALELVVFVAGIDSNLKYHELAIELIGSWAASNWRHALDATLTIDAQALRWELQKRALAAAAESDLNELLSSLDSLPEQLQDRAHTLALVEIAKQSPELAAERLSEIAENEERELFVEAVVESWAKKDIAGVIQWIDTTSGLPTHRDKLKELAFRELVTFDWQLAFETGLSLPLSAEDIGWEGTVVKWLANWNSDLAESLSVKVRPGRGRIEAYGGIIANAIWDHDYQRALDVFLILCEQEENADQSIYLMPLAYTVPDLVFSSIDKIASSRARVKVAQKLQFRFADSGVFTAEEMKRINQIANSENH